MPSHLNTIKANSTRFLQRYPKESPNYSRMINDFYTERVIKLVKSHGGNSISGGDFDQTEKYTNPTIIIFNFLENTS